MELNPYYPSGFHLAPYMDYYFRGKYEDALTEALKFNFSGLYLDPMMRAAALGQMGRAKEAKAAVGVLLEMVPNFAANSRQLFGNYVKVDDLIDKIIDGLRKAGLGDMGAFEIEAY